MIDRGDTQGAMALLSSDFKAYHASNPSPLGRQEMLGMIAMFAAAFPDGRHTFEQLVAEGDSVSFRTTYSGTHRGSFQGMPPTGKPVAIAEMGIVRVQAGTLIELRMMPDLLGLMQQLGAIPAQAAT